MKRFTVLALCLIIGLSAGQSFADDRELRDAIEVAKKQLKTEERELREFKSLISELERFAKESSNANRRRVINRMQDMMVDEILAVEGRVSKVHKIQQHGVDPKDKDRQASAKDSKNTLPGEAKGYKNDWTTGGDGGKPSLSRLTHMQSIYRVCSRAREPAINKHERAVPAYIQRVHEFARLWETEMRSLRTFTQTGQTPEKPETTQSNIGG